MGDNQEQGVTGLVNEDYGKHLRRGNTKADSKPIPKICHCRSLQCK